jgi:hypothetical protein
MTMTSAMTQIIVRLSVGATPKSRLDTNRVTTVAAATPD